MFSNHRVDYLINETPQGAAIFDSNIQHGDTETHYLVRTSPLCMLQTKPTVKLNPI